ncbi:MAG: hypothetical protein CVV13_02490 [Gammaproteobacteria bacterium HGW-Gammaproteobacteria-3]|jgi:hypothetical protein|nr:MAG: hypothetical protein CVV13_02490 [Gammaproteobacteria bacterium HGW-Gammaproteobacteria-3]
MRFFLDKDMTHIKQYASTSLTMIALARNIGFKKIVIHGLDFGGPHFFHADDFDNITNLKPAIYDYQKDLPLHTTSDSNLGVGVKDVISVLFKLLEEDDVLLMAASSSSPASDYLPVYQQK